MLFALPNAQKGAIGTLTIGDIVVVDAGLDSWALYKDEANKIDLSKAPLRSKLVVACRLLLQSEGIRFYQKLFVIRFSLKSEAPHRQEQIVSSQQISGEDLLATLDLAPSRDRTALIDGMPALDQGSSSRTRIIAFYLPQFYPFSENDRWWGDGFTEWSNVVDAKPQVQGHNMPLLPADLGFYDLRVEDTRARQAQLAADYGIDGFCYYFYWFSGRRIMREVLDAILISGQPKTDYCLCWANESWSRRWDGSESQVDLLIGQKHDPDVDETLIHDLLPYFHDERYIKIDGSPVILIYRLDIMNEPERVIAAWRRGAHAAGFPGVFVAAVRSFGLRDEKATAVDAIVDFPPHTAVSAEIQSDLPVNPDFKGKVYDYRQVIIDAATRPIGEKMCFPGVMPRWDNSARKAERSHIFWNSTPTAFKLWLSLAMQQSQQLPLGHRMLFINSWNEWGEGAMLEPDRHSGRAFLEAVRSTRGGYVVGPSESAKFALISNLPETGAEAILNNFSAEVQIVSDIMSWQRAKRHDAFRIGPPEIIVLAQRVPVFQDGRMNIEHSSIKLQGGRIVLRYGQPLMLIGWAMMNRSAPHVWDRVGYLCLTREGEDEVAYHALLTRWSARRDVIAYFELPLEAHDGYFGFEVTVGTDNVQTGTYVISVIQAHGGELLAAPTDVRLERVAS